MSFPPGKRYSWFIIAHDYNMHSHKNNFREDGICADSDEWHRLANQVQPCNILVKFDPAADEPPD